MEGNNFIGFLKNNIGFLIGLLIGILIVAFKLAEVFLRFVVIVVFAFLGMYIQRNQAKVRSTLKGLLKRIDDKL